MFVTYKQTKTPGPLVLLDSFIKEINKKKKVSYSENEEHFFKSDDEFLYTSVD